jgi:hypothetical protein
MDMITIKYLHLIKRKIDFACDRYKEKVLCKMVFRLLKWIYLPSLLGII